MFFEVLYLIALFSAVKCESVIYYLNGAWGSEAKEFVKEIGGRIRERGSDSRSGAFLVQRLAIAIQRGNAASVMGSFAPGTFSDSSYERMPAVIHRDDQIGCERYCAIDAHLVTDAPSELYDIIVKYSARKLTHYNHTRLRYGICVSKTCQIYFSNTTRDQTASLEACLNNSLWRDYQLKARIDKTICDDEVKNKHKIDAGDITMVVVIIVILLLNISGILQEVFVKKKENHNKIMSCFSLQRNAKILFNTKIPSEFVLQSMYGFKAITMFNVILGHFGYATGFTDTGVRVTEKAQDYIAFGIEATLISQIFFVISAYLITHAVLKNRDLLTKKKPLVLIFLFSLRRWLRFTPVYFLMVGLTSTLLRFVISNPLSEMFVGTSISDCRRDWWQMMLYIINYNDHSQCMVETWFISTELYMSIVTVAILVLTQGKTRIVVLGLLFAAGAIMSGVHTYLQDLDGTTFPRPEDLINYMVTNPTFHHVYKRTHTNCSAYSVGAALAIFIAHLEQKDKKIKHSLVLRFFTWISVLVTPPQLSAGAMFYMQGPRFSIYIRTIWAVIRIPVYALAVAGILLGQHLRLGGIHNIYNLLRWRLWIVPSRISFTMYLLNFFIFRFFIAYFTTVRFTSDLQKFAIMFMLMGICYLLSIPVWLMVEAPFVNLTKLLMDRPKKEKEEDTQKNVNLSVISN